MSFNTAARVPSTSLADFGQRAKHKTENTRRPGTSCMIPVAMNCFETYRAFDDCPAADDGEREAL